MTVGDSKTPGVGRNTRITQEITSSYFSEGQFLFSYTTETLTGREEAVDIGVEDLPKQELYDQRDVEATELDRISRRIPGRIRGLGLVALGASLPEAASEALSKDYGTGFIVFGGGLIVLLLADTVRTGYLNVKADKIKEGNTRVSLFNRVIEARERIMSRPRTQESH